MAKINKNRKKENIRYKLSQILQHDSNNPKFEGVTIIELKLSPDASHAVVFFSVFNSRYQPEEVTKALNSAAGFFQAKLAKTLHSRNTPKLNFVFDTGFDHADRIDQIIREIHSKD